MDYYAWKFWALRSQYFSSKLNGLNLQFFFKSKSPGPICNYQLIRTANQAKFHSYMAELPMLISSQILKDPRICKRNNGTTFHHHFYFKTIDHRVPAFSCIIFCLQLVWLGTSQAQGAAGSDNLTQEELDRMLALSLAQGNQATGTTSTGPSNSQDKSCQIS